MSDCMTFPNTVEEFMEQYKVVDMDHVYTNGVEFIPIFRMKQWFEHLPSVQPEIIRCKECKHWYSDADSGMACEFTNLSQPDDGYCNWAERRTDE